MISNFMGLIPHGVILICNMYIVFFLIDRVNTAMCFIDNDLTKALLVIMCAVSMGISVLLIRAQRRADAEEARKGLMNFDLRAHPTIEGINSCIRICERAIEVIAPAIAVADELKVLYECNLGLHPRQIEEGKSIRTALIECKKFFEEEIKKLNWQMNFVESANATQKSSSKPRNIKPKVVVAKAEDMTYPYDGELTRAIYNYLAETKRLTANWDVFNNAVMCGNYAQLDTPANAKAQLCQIIHLFDIYICGGLYGHNAANSIGLSGRTNLTQQASNLPDNFKAESEQIFRQWAKKQSRK
jgi:hypothetical protein